jgi:hypothetical protein
MRLTFFAQKQEMNPAVDLQQNKNSIRQTKTPVRTMKRHDLGESVYEHCEYFQIHERMGAPDSVVL